MNLNNALYLIPGLSLCPDLNLKIIFLRMIVYSL